MRSACPSSSTPILSTGPERRPGGQVDTGYSGRMEQKRDEPTDALWSRLRLIEGQPLNARAAAYGAVHDELMKRLDSAPRDARDGAATR